ncbi:MAG: SDR family NAD(P)-dependent oxidoreductase [Anaerolineae bacterium]|nr:SDR family NAD(P)-dependent oxidoreductase [Anaerolineae bacterium]
MTATNTLAGKTIVVTGATSGIGRATATALAARGAGIIGVGRSPQRCEETREAIVAAHPEAQISFCLADLSSQQQIRALALEIERRLLERGEKKLDVLVNNAGAVSRWYVVTEDGYELQFAVNHLAPFLLTHELLPLLRNAPAARVITVSSGSHYNTRVHWPDVMLRHTYHCLTAYKQSKLANVLFTEEFNRRIGRETHIRAYAADPGLVNTQIGTKGTGGLISWWWSRHSARGVTPEKGAETVIFLASDPAVAATPSSYWKDCRPKLPSRYARNAAHAARLWELSERLCGIADPEGLSETALRAATSGASR